MWENADQKNSESRHFLRSDPSLVYLQIIFDILQSSMLFTSHVKKRRDITVAWLEKRTFNVDKIRAISDYPFWDLLSLEKEESCWYHRYKICAIALNALYGAWKMSKYGVFSGPYFLYSDWIQENTDYKNVVFGHFSSSDTLNLCISFITIW